MQPIVALDFDGVICDSLDECLITAYNTYHRLQGQDRWVSDVTDIDQNVADRFRRLRYLARNAPELYLIMHWILTQSGDLDQDRLQVFKSSHSNNLAEFEAAFFESRQLFRAADLSKWLGLHRIYPQFQNGWDEVRRRARVFLITTKDQASIKHFNHHWGLGIPAKNIWTQERALTKGEIAARILKKSRNEPENLLFVDDHPDHLKDVSTTGARCFWASWGYLGAQGKTPAAGSNFISISRLAEILPYLTTD